MLAFCGCGKEEIPELNQDRLIEITSKPIGMTEDYMSYTLHICIYNDCSVEIYADNFDKLYDELDRKTQHISISSTELDALKELILKERAYDMRENVGNRDLTIGTAKTFTVYSSFGTHKSGGLSPSNINFLKVYDFVYNLAREESIEYCRILDKKLLDGYNNRYNLGPRIHNYNDEIIVSTDMIEEFKVVSYDDIFDATDSDAEKESASEENSQENIVENVNEEVSENSGDNGETDNEVEQFTVAIILNDSGAEAVAEATKGINVNPENYFLYNKDIFCAMITANAPINDGVLYLNVIYDSDAAKNLKDELDKYLDMWRNCKIEDEK
ncbi:MAG: hypothetical protein K2G45_00785 [Lachnospiraceae bacterium]|nr:hypothetical protein [Lachnospiraceae bacterium]